VKCKISGVPVAQPAQKFGGSKKFWGCQNA